MVNKDTGNCYLDTKTLLVWAATLLAKVLAVLMAIVTACCSINHQLDFQQHTQMPVLVQFIEGHLTTLKVLSGAALATLGMPLASSLYAVALLTDLYFEYQMNP